MWALRRVKSPSGHAFRAFQRLRLPSLALNARGIHAQAIEFLPSNQPDFTESQREVREAVSKICSKYPDEYWLKKDEDHEFPHELHRDLADAGWLGICLPQEYGGAGLGILEAATMMQTISESGAGLAGASSIHMNIFGLEPVAKFGTNEQKERFLIPLIEGKDRACFGVTEPNSGLDTLKLQSQATRHGEHYTLKGSKIWTSTAQVANKILILVRTTPLDQVQKPTQGLSLFYTDLDRAKVKVTEISKLGRAAVDSNVIFFEDWQVHERDRIGQEGEGFKLLTYGLNAERVLVASEAIGLGYAALRRAGIYAKERSVFGRPIGQNQGIQHPLAESWIKLESARLLVYQAARLFDQGYKSGEYANGAKYIAAEAAFEACERAVFTHGGMGYAKEYHVERYLREAMLPRLAPVSRELIFSYVAERVLGLPKSY